MTISAGLHNRGLISNQRLTCTHSLGCVGWHIIRLLVLEARLEAPEEQPAGSMD
jgi:hypothetical protein